MEDASSPNLATRLHERQQEQQPDEPQRGTEPTSRMTRLFKWPTRDGSMRSTRSTASTTIGGSEYDLEASQLVYDEDEGVFSGWIYVQSSPPNIKQQHKARCSFTRRFCRLRELVCTFYTTENPFEVPVEQHVIISVERLHMINKGFMFKNHEDSTVWLHTTQLANFEDWYNAFAAVVRQTRIAKPRAVSSESFGRQRVRRAKRKAERRAAERMAALPECTDDRQRSFTEPDPVTPGLTDPEASNVSQDQDDEVSADDLTRTHASWFYVQQPWWRLRHRSRRYIVLSGTTVSCFTLNKDGHPAEFVRSVQSVAYNPETDPLSVELHCGQARPLRLSATSSKVARQWKERLQHSLERGL
ncbi:TPA: hypothetical protein N0F65_008951 [Lagenidium giganteum]|uniref:PH domain-containing protein n=1 Tax=Lagenidium giganteum TaxID=4803 RepID=A0AAV2YVC9_9STRA|nr:TPA: hypothetical protein N0F65_008951 [Lagenidium giganteum]